MSIPAMDGEAWRRGRAARLRLHHGDALADRIARPGTRLIDKPFTREQLATAVRAMLDAA